MTAPRATVPLPLTALHPYIGVDDWPTGLEWGSTLGRRTPYNAIRIAAACGVSRRAVHRWLNTGVIPARSAEKVAEHLGQHPATIWGDDWWGAVNDDGSLRKVPSSC